MTDDREIVIINRRGRENVALIPASDLSSLMETAYLLRSPKNARRLLEAIRRSQANEVRPSSVEELRREFGLDREEELSPLTGQAWRRRSRRKGPKLDLA